MKPLLVAERLEVVIGLDGPPHRLRNIIERELTAHFLLPAIQAAEKAEQIEGAVAAQILQRQLKAEALGILSRIVLVGSSEHYIAGCCFVQPTDPAVVAKAKVHRLGANPLLAKIQALTFKDFELFGSKVLGQLGAQKIYVTRQSNDQGIDFYGILNLGQFQPAPTPFFRLAHDLEVRFAGQAKHYPINPVGTSVVRELTGAISLARFKTFSDDKDLFENLSLKPLSPLIPIILTTGRFTSGAIELAGKAGMIARSGEQLAVFLADCGVGMKTTTAGATFCEAIFDDWLHSS